MHIYSSKTIIYTLFIKVIDKFLEDIYDDFGVTSFLSLFIFTICMLEIIIKIEINDYKIAFWRKNRMNNFINKITRSKLEPFAHFVYELVAEIEYIILSVIFFFTKRKKISEAEREKVRENVTFIYKSFERPKMAKRLYKSIQRYYPGAKVIIADDSKIPLEFEGEFLEIIHLPFNSGLCYGLNRALEKVKTPYLVRLDDDMQITSMTDVEGQLEFLEKNKNVDLVGFGVVTAPKCKSTKKSMAIYYNVSYNKPLIIPRLTKIDSNHIVVEKSVNIFLARTEKIRNVGWDDNIRMIDHNEFFYRAAVKIVSVMSQNTVIFHRHNPFDKHYFKYRNDYYGDLAYIRKKHSLNSKSK